MNAQPTGLGHRVDQAAERRAAAQGEVVTLGEVRLRYVAQIKSLRARPQRRCVQSGGVDDLTGDEFSALSTTKNFHFDSCLRFILKRCKRFHL